MPVWEKSYPDTGKPLGVAVWEKSHPDTGKPPGSARLGKSQQPEMGKPMGVAIWEIPGGVYQPGQKSLCDYDESVKSASVVHFQKVPQGITE